MIDGDQLDGSTFGRYIDEVFSALQCSKEPVPFFRFITVAALHVFINERVDVAIFEVGIGGRFDSTNIISSPIVCGISSLALEHTNLLGTTLEAIAWHKCGIFKSVLRCGRYYSVLLHLSQTKVPMRNSMTCVSSTPKRRDQGRSL